MRYIVVVGSEWYGRPLKNILPGIEVTSSLKMLEQRPDQVGLVLFTGGEDIFPSFYSGHDSKGFCYTNERRDFFEQGIFNFCRQRHIRMTGICRGFQLLNVLSGGKMYQHIEKHAGCWHPAYFSWLGTSQYVTSTHHQLVMLPKDAIPISWSSEKRSSIYIGPFGEVAESPEKEIEAAIFPSSKTIGVQFHPEMMTNESPALATYMVLMRDYISLPFETFLKKYSEAPHASQKIAGRDN